MNPRRVAVGFESSRLALLLAVLHRHGGVATAGRDVFVNVVGGVRIGETSADLPAVLAVLSSLRDKPLAADTVCFGELGLTGEIRPVPFGEERLREAAKQGFSRALVPAANVPRKPIEGITVEGVGRLAGSAGARVVTSSRDSGVLAQRHDVAFTVAEPRGLAPPTVAIPF